MNQSILFAVADLPRVAEETAKTFGLNGPIFIAQVVNFIVVATLLRFLAYKPILKVLEERRQRIAEGLANAEKSKAELAKAEAGRLEVLGQANTQANQLIAEARAAAARLFEQESQKAMVEAEQILSKARQTALADHARMMTELKREVGRLVVQTAAAVTGKILTPQDQQRLAEETGRQLAT